MENMREVEYVSLVLLTRYILLVARRLQHAPVHEQPVMTEPAPTVVTMLILTVQALALVTKDTT